MSIVGEKMKPCLRQRGESRISSDRQKKKTPCTAILMELWILLQILWTKSYAISLKLKLNSLPFYSCVFYSTYSFSITTIRTAIGILYTLHFQKNIIELYKNGKVDYFRDKCCQKYALYQKFLQIKVVQR